MPDDGLSNNYMLLPFLAIAILVIVSVMGLAGRRARKEAAEVKALADGQNPILAPILEYAAKRTASWDRCFPARLFDKDKILFGALAAIIWSIVNHSDKLYPADIGLVLQFLRERNLATTYRSIEDVSGTIYELGEDFGVVVSGLALLRAEDPEEASRVAQIYLDLAIAIAGSPTELSESRQACLVIVEAQLRPIISPEPPNEPNQSVKEMIEELRNTIQTLRDAMEHLNLAPTDPRRNLLEVSGTATSEEVRAAYRAKVQLWHPDRLSGMAPELQSLATERLAALNEAYKALAAESTQGRDI